MLKPGVTVERMFKDVRNAVVETTKSAQIPWESSSLTGGDFFFHPAEVIAATPSSTEATNKDFELLYWQSVLNSNSPEDYEAYLSQYPNGVFAALAKVKIARLISSVDNSSIEEPDEAESTASLSEQSTINAVGSNIDISGSYVSELTGKKDRLDATGKNQTVVIEQNGNKVKGTFGSAGDHGGEIEGTVDGNTITFDWYSSWTYGEGKWEIKPGSNSLFGTWGTSGYEGAGKWNLTRLISPAENFLIEEPREAASTASLSEQSTINADGSSIDISGTYRSIITGSTQALNIKGRNPEVKLIQKGKNISGTFGNKGGMIWGSIKNGKLKFRFQSSGGNEGRGEWVVEPDSNEITGNWAASWNGEGEWNLIRIK
jgi:hypothetical protein